GGTLFLDEVGDMTPPTQAKILRLLQEGRFERIGGSETISVDVRVIAATNQSLDALIAEGRFRKDLYYRLRGVTIQLPPLRERREDIPELVYYFLFRYNRQLGMSVQSVAQDAMEILQAYHWPGNVRQLQSVVREALIVSAGPTLLAEFLPSELRAGEVDEELPVLAEAGRRSEWDAIPEFVESAIASGERDVYRRTLEHFDRLLLSRALQQVRGNQAHAAELLGISRVTLRAKLRAMRLSVAKVVTFNEPVAGE
ncbi:MAG TPA: sigma 54-interacting transcriptional regulator, partial [Planctomycetaceae bacterium]|nr:sigma 54-interacting transcriptional regulator [Planctomycetaceae bacterium]